MNLRWIGLSLLAAVAVVGSILLPHVHFRSEWESGQLVLEREVIIRDEIRHATIQPQALIRTQDGGYLIAGRIRATKSALAIKVDGNGKVLWRYDRESPQGERKVLGGGAQFSTAVELPDGSFLLGGRDERPESNASTGLLVKLDSAGRLTSDTLVPPGALEAMLGGESISVLSYIDKLARWGNGVAVAGHCSQIVVSAASPGGRQANSFYWIARLDETGNPQWQVAVSPLDGQSTVGVTSEIIAPDDSLVFIGRRSTDAEIVRIDQGGVLRAQMPLYGAFKLVIPLLPDGPLRLFGKSHRADGLDGDWSMVTLDQNLKSTHTIRGPKPAGFSLGDPDVFELPDRSLALFGSVVADRVQRAVSRIAVVSSNLKHETFLDPTQSPLTDHALLGAAIPTGRPGEFAVAKTLQDLELNFADPGVRMGMGFDFIQIR